MLFYGDVDGGLPQSLERMPPPDGEAMSNAPHVHFRQAPVILWCFNITFVMTVKILNLHHPNWKSLANLIPIRPTAQSVQHLMQTSVPSKSAILD